MLNLNNNSYSHLKSGIKRFLKLERNSIGTGGSDDSRYCYTFLLRHLYYLNMNYGVNKLPDSILEIGPGDSIGSGILALLMGVNNYAAIDAVEHSNNERNLRILNDLYLLLLNTEYIPDNKEFPEVFPYLDDYKFPEFIKMNLPSKEEIGLRKTEIEKALYNQSDLIKINYISNWNIKELHLNEEFGLIYSQAVMEHIEDINSTYLFFYNWLKAGGYISHTIDYRSHGESDKWNGHWEINDILWKIILKGYGYCINRKPHSYHINIVKKYFKDLKVMVKYDESGIKRTNKRKYSDFADEDFIISTSFIQGVKN